MNRRHPRRPAAAPAPARIELHLDELVLHGVAARDRHRVADAVHAELARLLAEQGLPGGLASRETPTPAPVPATATVRTTRPDDLGRGVAGAIYRSLAPRAPSSKGGGS
ncbi:MAG TPA: hypothetical protein VHE35_28285 [Kofleriaceae bacterium]|nr:hypothetical protein [Kofleriaceae bacterium]